MQLTVRLLGVEVLHINLADGDESSTQATDCTTYPVGYAPDLGCLVVTALDPRHRFLLDLLLHARRDKAHGWGN